MGLAKIKFSGSPRKNGIKKIKTSIKQKMSKKNHMSFEEKNQWKEIIFIFLGKFRGLLLPVACRKNKWRIIKPKRINGKQK
jgi:hypothetical protein